MAQWLKQSTARTIKLGPFLDDTDGKTAETGLTIAQADIRLSKNGGAFAQTNNATGATHDENGVYGVPLDATDTNSLGLLRVEIHESGALPVSQDFMIVPANVWDSMFGADKLDVSVEEWKGATAPAMTGDAFARLGVPAGASLSADIADLPTNAELATSQASADDATLAAITALNNLSAAQVNTEVAAALVAIHLDHLLAVDYDPASKPGVATALLNELIESDAGVSRFTANALELAPTAGSVVLPAVDGLTMENALEVILAVAAGVAQISGNAISFKRRNGTTSKVTVTTHATIAGERISSVINS